jgi:hypothetical protein
MTSIPIKVLHKIMKENKEFEELCYRYSMLYLINLYESRAPNLVKFDE